MKRFLIFLILALPTGLTASRAPSAPSPVERELRVLLEKQAAAWNKGDIDGFMAGYAATNELRFASGGKVTYGWEATRAGYKKRYPDASAMGNLAFSDLVVTELGPDAALIFGRWQLTRAHDLPHGLFTLTVRKTAAGWRIIQDHTSSASE